jgi:hypothetical protein
MQDIKDSEKMMLLRTHGLVVGVVLRWVMLVVVYALICHLIAQCVEHNVSGAGRQAANRQTCPPVL